MKPSIILIEDDQWLADSFRSTLHAAGYNVRVFSTGHEAMDAIDTRLPDLVVADILLGDHTSLTLLHELQSYKDTARIPVIVCTGVDMSALESGSMKSYGVVSILDKSTVTPEQLLHVVAEHIGETGRPPR